jgi:hypothetical protein
MHWFLLIAVAVIAYWAGKLRAIQQVDKARKEGRVKIVPPQK